MVAAGDSDTPPSYYEPAVLPLHSRSGTASEGRSICGLGGRWYCANAGTVLDISNEGHQDSTQVCDDMRRIKTSVLLPLVSTYPHILIVCVHLIVASLAHS